MYFAAWMRVLLGVLMLLLSSTALAADRCPVLSKNQADPLVATRIAAVVCEEHLRWNRPFIDAQGRLASLSAYEAEGNGLKDGGAPWRRVAFYWQTTGLLSTMAYKPGAIDCAHAALSLASPGLACRGFVIDTAWSAAFISWVMQRAGVPGFSTSASHFDYVRDARRKPDASPYHFISPWTASLQTGDMVCYVRGNRVYGHEGLAKLIDGGAGGLPMHCDLVASIDDGKAYVIGGNVQQAVTMRIFELDSEGRLAGLKRRTDGDVECSPETESACSFNRQDWAAVLKLKPQNELARIGSVLPRAGLPIAPVPPSCCVNCVLGSGIPRCPVPGQTPLAQPSPPQDLPPDAG